LCLDKTLSISLCDKQNNRMPGKILIKIRKYKNPKFQLNAFAFIKIKKNQNQFYRNKKKKQKQYFLNIYRYYISIYQSPNEKSKK